MSVTVLYTMTYAWIEYFKASEQGGVAKEYVENKNASTPTIIITEISRKLSQQILLGKETEEGSANIWIFLEIPAELLNWTLKQPPK
jgi:hypothetical protein